MKTFLRRMLQRTRYLRRGYKAASSVAHHSTALLLSRRLLNHPGQRAKQLSLAVKALYEETDAQGSDWAYKIEGFRTQMLANKELLVDGALGEPGIYDRVNRTIADACAVSKPPRAALFLYCLVRAIGSNRVLELGTNVGISSAYLAAAIEQNNTGGKLFTLESSPYRQRLAARLHKSLGLNCVTYIQGLFADQLSRVLQGTNEIDLAFIDGHHQYQPTLDYLNQIVVSASTGCVFVFDDIRWSDGMKRAWAEIKHDQRFDLVLDLHTVGLCVLGESDNSQRFVEGPFKIF